MTAALTTGLQYVLTEDYRYNAAKGNILGFISSILHRAAILQHVESCFPGFPSVNSDAAAR
jgi:hypothetical protein